VRDFFADGTAPGRGIEVIGFADGTQWTRADLQGAPPLAGNAAPLAAADGFATLVDRPLQLGAAQLLANDADLEGDALAVTAVQAGARGSVSLDAATGGILFTPERYYTGPAWFSYTVSDGQGTASARVDVQVDIDASGNARLGSAAADTLAGTRNDDRLYGLGGNDVLRADRGNDLLAGGAGNDTLEGSAGNDTYVYQRGEGQDLIDNRSARATDVDGLWLTGGITREELWFLREGNDLLIGTGSAGERITVDEWFATPEARIDEIHAGGQVLYAAEVERLVQAMAAFDAPVGSGFLQAAEPTAIVESTLARPAYSGSPSSALL
jgi:hypothetical protein